MNAVKEHLTFEHIYALGRLQHHLRHKGIQITFCLMQYLFELFA